MQLDVNILWTCPSTLRSVGFNKAINMVVIKIVQALYAASCFFFFLISFYKYLSSWLNELPGRNLRQEGLKLAGYESFLQLVLWPEKEHTHIVKFGYLWVEQGKKWFSRTIVLLKRLLDVVQDVTIDKVEKLLLWLGSIQLHCSAEEQVSKCPA